MNYFRSLLKLEKFQTEFGLNLSWHEFTKHCISASILTLVNKSQMEILLHDTKAYKSFDNWAKKYELTTLKLKRISDLNALWTSKPSSAEVASFELKSQRHGIWSKLKRKQYHNQFFKDYNGKVYYDQALSLVDNLKAEYDVTAALDEISIKLKHNLKIANPKEEIGTILEN